MSADMITPNGKGFVAIDDIAFSPECQPDPTATLPVQPPDECNPDIQFRYDCLDEYGSRKIITS